MTEHSASPFFSQCHHMLHEPETVVMAHIIPLMHSVCCQWEYCAEGHLSVDTLNCKADVSDEIDLDLYNQVTKVKTF